MSEDWRCAGIENIDFSEYDMVFVDVSRHLFRLTEAHPTGIDRISLYHLFYLEGLYKTKLRCVSRAGSSFVLLKAGENTALLRWLAKKWDATLLRDVGPEPKNDHAWIPMADAGSPHATAALRSRLQKRFDFPQLDAALKIWEKATRSQTV